MPTKFSFHPWLVLLAVVLALMPVASTLASVGTPNTDRALAALDSENAGSQLAPVNNPFPIAPSIPLTTQPAPINVVRNSGFESGSWPWVQYSSGGRQIIATSRPHYGAYSAAFCNYHNCNEYIEQTLTVPVNGVLNYYWYMTSSEGTAVVYDYLSVQVYSNSGVRLGTLRTWSNRNTRNAWSYDVVSLSAYAGQTIRIRFVAHTDASLLSAFWVDDVVVR